MDDELVLRMMPDFEDGREERRNKTHTSYSGEIWTIGREGRALARELSKLWQAASCVGVQFKIIACLTTNFQVVHV